MTESAPSHPVPYATPAPSGTSRALAASAVTFAGLALIFFGGCFMVGIMIQLWPALVFGTQITKPWSDRDYVFHAALYVLAAGCFIAGGVLLFRGAAALLRVLTEHR